MVGNSEKWPFLISIPHGSLLIPDQISDFYALSEIDLFWDSDAYTDILFDFQDQAAATIKAETARAVVDLNRPPDLAALHPDGVIKTATCLGKVIYNSALPASLMENLLTEFYYPYHNSIKKQLKRDDILMGFDCHSMLAVGPPAAQDYGLERPLINLGNNKHKSSSRKLITLFAECLIESFNLQKKDISINTPFAGGYITRTYGAEAKPWIQIELNRNLYLDIPAANTDLPAISPMRSNEIRSSLAAAFTVFTEAVQIDKSLLRRDEQ